MKPILLLTLALLTLTAFGANRTSAEPNEKRLLDWSLFSNKKTFTVPIVIFEEIQSYYYSPVD